MCGRCICLVTVVLLAAQDNVASALHGFFRPDAMPPERTLEVNRWYLINRPHTLES